MTATDWTALGLHSGIVGGAIRVDAAAVATGAKPLIVWCGVVGVFPDPTNGFANAVLVLHS